MRYPVVIHKDPGSDFGVTVPDLPGCFSSGESFEEALANAVEAIELHVEGLLLDRQAVSGPKPVEAHRHNPEFAGGIWAMVDVNPAKLTMKSRPVTLNLPEEIIDRVDHLASRIGGSRETVIANAALEYLAERQGS